MIDEPTGRLAFLVAHIGDSTSAGLVSPLDLPDPAQRLAARYREVGVRRSWIDASGGRSMVEEMPGQANGYDTARVMASRGFRPSFKAAVPGLSEPMPGHYVSPVEGDGRIPDDYYV